MEHVIDLVLEQLVFSPDVIEARFLSALVHCVGVFAGDKHRDGFLRVGEFGCDDDEEELERKERADEGEADEVEARPEGVDVLDAVHELRPLAERHDLRRQTQAHEASDRSPA